MALEAKWGWISLTCSFAENPKLLRKWSIYWVCSESSCIFTILTRTVHCESYRTKLKQILRPSKNMETLRFWQISRKMHVPSSKKCVKLPLFALSIELSWRQRNDIFNVALCNWNIGFCQQKTWDFDDFNGNTKVGSTHSLISHNIYIVLRRSSSEGMSTMLSQFFSHRISWAVCPLFVHKNKKIRYILYSGLSLYSKIVWYTTQKHCQ